MANISKTDGRIPGPFISSKTADESETTCCSFFPSIISKLGRLFGSKTTLSAPLIQKPRVIVAEPPKQNSVGIFRRICNAFNRAFGLSQKQIDERDSRQLGNALLSSVKDPKERNVKAVEIILKSGQAAKIPPQILADVLQFAYFISSTSGDPEIKNLMNDFLETDAGKEVRPVVVGYAIDKASRAGGQHQYRASKALLEYAVANKVPVPIVILHDAYHNTQMKDVEHRDEFKPLFNQIFQFTHPGHEFSY